MQRNGMEESFSLKFTVAVVKSLRVKCNGAWQSQLPYVFWLML